MRAALIPLPVEIRTASQFERFFGYEAPGSFTAQGRERSRMVEAQEAFRSMTQRDHELFRAMLSLSAGRLGEPYHGRPIGELLVVEQPNEPRESIAALADLIRRDSAPPTDVFFDGLHVHRNRDGTHDVAPIEFPDDD